MHDIEPAYEEPDAAEVELQYAWIKVRGEARNNEEFLKHAAIVLRRSADLSPEELKEITELHAKPWKRPVMGAPKNIERDRSIWAKFILFEGRLHGGYDKDKPPLARAYAIKAIARKHEMTPDAARKVYDRIKREGKRETSQ